MKKKIKKLNLNKSTIMKMDTMHTRIMAFGGNNNPAMNISKDTCPCGLTYIECYGLHRK